MKKTCDHFRIPGSIRERMSEVEEQLMDRGVDANAAAATAFTTVMLDAASYLFKLPKQKIFLAMSSNRN